MPAPSGEQHLIAHGGWRAVATESGGALRLLEHDGRPVLDGFREHEMSSGGRGQLLVPWPNRIGDGAYRFGGRDLQLPLTEPARRNASHGLVRWAPWSLTERSEATVELGCRVMAQTGYPWTLDVAVRYTLSAAGLEVTQSAVNRSAEPAPYACGAHPYLAIGDGPVDDWELTLPAATRLLVDNRLLPVGREPVAGTPRDFRTPRVLGQTVLDDAFTDLARGPEGTVEVRVRCGDRTLALWGDESVRWLQLYTGDDRADVARRSLAVEPMTAPPDAFRSGDDLVVLEPGEGHVMRWGVSAGR